tara:strand:- start:1 stop:936 length:936 start_codon:yes stop_codon:yes gene_type:complete
MKIIVSGGAGFIGSNLVKFLLSKKHEVIVIDNFSTGFKKNLQKELDNIILIDKNLEDLNLDIYKDIDCFIHLAAQVSVPISIHSFKESSKSNILSSINTVDFCRTYNIPLVYASSSAVYGNLELGDDNYSDIDLLSPYAADKYFLEKFTKIFYSLSSLSSIGLRFFNVYGPNQDSNNPYSGVISIFVDRIYNKKPIIINGGDQTRDFIYVDDVVRVIYESVKIVSKRKTYEVVNVLTGKTTSIDKLAEIISKKLNFDPKRIYKPFPKGDLLKSIGSTKKMENLLDIDIKKMTKIEEGLDKTIKFTRNNHLR